MTNSTKVLAAMGIVAGLGVAAALPVTGHAEDVRTGATTVTATINETISISNVTPNVSGVIANNGGPVELTDDGLTTGDPGHFTITSNSASGYTVTALAGEKTGTPIADQVDKNLTSGTNTIAYNDSVLPATGVSGWNVTLDGEASPIPLATTGTNTFILKTDTTPATGTTYTVHYNAAANGSQPAGTYVGHVTYTVAKN